MKNLFKKPVFIISVIVIIIAAVIGYSYFKDKQVSPYQFVNVERKNITQIVSVTGNVKAAEDVNLGFERSGKVTAIKVRVNDKVAAGQVLANLNNADLAAQLAQARANLTVQQVNLDALKRGTRPEEIQVAQTSVDNAKKALVNAQNNLTNVKNNAAADLQEVYDGALSAAAKSVTVGINSIYVLTDIQYAHFMNYDQIGETIASAKADAVLALLGAANAGRWANSFLSPLNGGVKATVQNTQSNPTPANIDEALHVVESALEKVRLALAVITVTTDLSTTERTNLSTEKAGINAEITIITGKQQSIDVQKTTNSYNIANAESSVTTAQNSLAAAESQLALKQAGNTPDEIKAQEAQVMSAQANVDSYAAQLAKTVIYSPIAGIITQQNAKVGEIVNANTSLISVLSTAKFQIEANIPETDIAKVEINDSTQITLDAYGGRVIFDANVIKIDPAETIVEGVTTYKTTFQFTKDDERAKSGMTANIDITTAKKSAVLTIPQRAVTAKNGESYVLVDEGGQTPIERKIVTGLRGSEGDIEVISGLSEGQRVINGQQ